MPDIPPNLDELATAGKRVIAHILSTIEANPDDPELTVLLDQAHDAPTAHVLGLTGPPGVGKSTLTSAMIEVFRANNLSVGIIAVDPSSKVSGGALLGDRIRLKSDPADEEVFIRSFSSKGRLGGVSQATYAAMVLMRARYDWVIVETVGVGQSETTITDIADTVIFCVQPGSGDSVQFMKSGIMELPQIIVITKADMGASAQLALADVEGALDLRVKDETSARAAVILASAVSGEGLEALNASIINHRQEQEHAGVLGLAHQSKADIWIEDMIVTRFGEEGLQRAKPLMAEFSHLPVFTRKIAIFERLRG